MAAILKVHRGVSLGVDLVEGRAECKAEERVRWKVIKKANSPLRASSLQARWQNHIQFNNPRNNNPIHNL